MLYDDTNPVVLYKMQPSTYSGATLFEGPLALAEKVYRPIVNRDINTGSQRVKHSTIVGSKRDTGTLTPVSTSTLTYRFKA